MSFEWIPWLSNETLLRFSSPIPVDARVQYDEGEEGDDDEGDRVGDGHVVAAEESRQCACSMLLSHPTKCQSLTFRE